MAYARISATQKFEPKPGEHWFQTTTGMSGHFAVEVWMNNEDPAMPFPEPYDTGIGRYTTQLEAAEEAVMLADAQDLPCVLPEAIWEELVTKGLITPNAEGGWKNG